MISKKFAHHIPSEENFKRINILRRVYSELEDLIQDYCAEGREKSVALTQLETAAMWTMKAVVINDPQEGV